jgi:hypothetical protein
MIQRVHRSSQRQQHPGAAAAVTTVNRTSIGFEEFNHALEARAEQRTAHV